MRVRRQAATSTQLAPVVSYLPSTQSSFKKGPGINPRRGVRLKVHLIATIVSALRSKEVVKTHLHHGGSRQIGRNMAANAGTAIVGLEYHRHRIPANDVLDAGFNFDVAGIFALIENVYGVAIERIERAPNRCTGGKCQARFQLSEDRASTIRPAFA